MNYTLNLKCITSPSFTTYSFPARKSTAGPGTCFADIRSILHVSVIPKNAINSPLNLLIKKNDSGNTVNYEINLENESNKFWKLTVNENSKFVKINNAKYIQFIIEWVPPSKERWAPHAP